MVGVNPAAQHTELCLTWTRTTWLNDVESNDVDIGVLLCRGPGAEQHTWSCVLEAATSLATWLLHTVVNLNIVLT